METELKLPLTEDAPGGCGMQLPDLVTTTHFVKHALKFRELPAHSCSGFRPHSTSDILPSTVLLSLEPSS